jgi:quinol monooxygenase YgiN
MPRDEGYAAAMVLEQLEVAILDRQEAAFEAALCEVRQRVFMSRGFRGFTVAQGADQPSTYLVQVLWESAEELADFERFRFERCWTPIRPFLAGPLQVRHYLQRTSLDLTGPGVIADLAWLSE